MKRILRVDVCDYENNVLCNLYDNQCKSSGAAVDVYVTTERNGWKELTFTIPTTCETDEGIEENFRLEYLKADYKLRTIDDYEKDYYYISEPKINHNAFAKNVEVRAGHVAQILKNKAIDLEFSDTEGNNVGTAQAILETILEGTGWSVGYVENFREDDGSQKVRSMNASAGTGAYGLIENLCELFEAKPIYHGDSKTVDIVSMNPFSNVNPGEIPEEVLNGRNVLELYYDRNLKNLEKTVNADTIVTRLYTYGAYGDVVAGYCGISTCKHDEYTFNISGKTGDWFEFCDKTNAHYFFRLDENVTSDQNLVWSYMDFVSRSYIWNESTQKAYRIYKEPEGAYTSIEGSTTSVINEFPYLMDFSYYDSVGLFTDNMLQTVAAYQRNMPALYTASKNAASAMVESEMKLSETGESNTGFAKLSVDVAHTSKVDNGTLIQLNNTDKTPAGVIYRSDYDESERYYFRWNVAKQFKSNGDPYNNIGSLIVVIHDGPPATWSQAYITHIYDSYGNLYVDDNGEPKGFDYGLDEDYPSSIIVHGDISIKEGDRVYLFCSNSLSGLLGEKLSEAEAAYQDLESYTMDVTIKHPVYFRDVKRGDVIPSTEAIRSSYGWRYDYSDIPDDNGNYIKSKLYFCWGDKNGDYQWKNVYAQETEPTVEEGAYFFSTKYKTLHHGESGKWFKYESSNDKIVANMFTRVLYMCNRRDMLYRGLYENYTYSNMSLPVGCYAIPSDYCFYWVFTTDKVGGNYRYETKTGFVHRDDDIDNSVTASMYPYDAVFYPSENDLTDFIQGSLNDNGVEVDSKQFYRTGHFSVYESTTYEYLLPKNSTIYFYTSGLKFIEKRSIGGSSQATVKTPVNTSQARVVCDGKPKSSCYFRVQDYENKIFISNREYIVLRDFEGEGRLIGINTLIHDFAEYADDTYERYLVAMKKAQQDIKDADAVLTDVLGDVLRENKWQDSSYVEGDEDRLYKDALDNLREIAKPEISYSFSYLDMFGANHDIHYFEDDDHEIEWPDIKITDAAHLVDPEIDTNCWAYIDRINKCYDQPWLTTIEINTNLSLVGQHEFTDVLSRIAEVAKEVKARQSIYDRAAVISSNGAISGAVLEGAISLNQIYLDGGASSYHTDQYGNIIFESADGMSAMIVGGRGIGVSTQKNKDGDWQWRSAITGQGLTADVITTGYLRGERIEAGTITADKLTSNIGQELEIGSNKALLLYATESGTRPAGSVLTSADAAIEIKAGRKDVVGDNGYIKINSGGNIDINANGSINISSQGKLDLASGGEFTLRANGADTVDSTKDGIYIGNDGVNLGGGKFKFKKSGDSSDLIVNSQTIFFGDLTYKDNNNKDQNYTVGSIIKGAGLTIDSINGTMVLSAANTITINSGASLTMVTNGSVTIGNGSKPFTIGADKTNAYIYNGKTSISDTKNDGIYIGTNGIFIGKKDGDYIKATVDGTIDISGKITANSGTIGGWTIGADYLGDESELKKCTIGIRKGTADTNIVFFAGTESGKNDISTAKFKVTKAGALTATNANIKGAITATSGKIGTWTIGSNFFGDGSELNKCTVGIKQGSGNNDVIFFAGVDSKSGETADSAKFRVQKNGNMIATAGNIGGWNIGAKLLYAKPNSSNYTGYVALDGSTDKYPLSGLTKPKDTMYAMWAGDQKPENAPFSVTKDGVVTIKRLRVVTASGQYREIDFNNFVYPTINSGEWNGFENLFGKLQFQTVKNVSQNTSNGQVTVYVTNNSGGTGKYTFNTATSVKLADGSWSGATEKAAATYTGLCFYNYGKTQVEVEKKDTATVISEWQSTGTSTGTKNTLSVYGRLVNVPSETARTLLFSYNFEHSAGSWSKDHKKNITIKTARNVSPDTKLEVLHISVDASGQYNDAWNKSATSVALKGSAADDKDTVNKTLDYGEKWIIRAKYIPAGSSIESNTGKTYVVKAPAESSTKPSSIQTSTAKDPSNAEKLESEPYISSSTKSIIVVVGGKRYYFNFTTG